MTPLGLDPTTEAVYRVALRRTNWTVECLYATCVESTGLPHDRIREAVCELSAVGLLRPAAGGSGAELRVVAPDVVLERRLEATREGIRGRQQELDTSAAVLRELQDLYRSARDAQLEYTNEKLTGLDAVRSRLEQLARGAQYEALSFMRGPQSCESMHVSWPLDRDALKRGVSLRSVYLHSALNHAETAAYLRRLDDAGAETRTVPTLPLQLLIVDRAVAVVPIDPENSAAGALVLRSRGSLVALLALFENVWLTARSISEPRRTERLELSDTDHEILRILAAGATDEVVARQLGVSVRTVRRLTSVLMDRFRARSRFELGLKLGQQGWAVSSSHQNQLVGSGAGTARPACGSPAGQCPGDQEPSDQAPGAR
jgi:DNA-binding CsgD family transcriptional regulator/sugar-specific transcriptional regulator TrmB